MPRIARVAPECGIFHITARGNNKRCVFRRDCEYSYYKKLLIRYKKKYKFLLYHYVLMKNHIHLSLKTTMDTDISKMMQGLQLSYGHYQRRTYKSVGYLWQGRFKSHVIEDDEYLLASALYIERNPVDAGVVNDPIEYKWSSYRYYALGENDPLVDPDPLYESLGSNKAERQKAYADLMSATIKEENIKRDRNKNALDGLVTLCGISG